MNQALLVHRAVAHAGVDQDSPADYAGEHGVGDQHGHAAGGVPNRDRTLQTQGLDDRGGVFAYLLKIEAALWMLGVAVAPEVE